mmetsp:Transcript_11422/g.28908  ORF Transcript_11422/g.28908 Transcript_11422/m.28908 type:complete len:203 (+) Transcript_11422:296-904(+)
MPMDMPGNIQPFAVYGREDQCATGLGAFVPWTHDPLAIPHYQSRPIRRRPMRKTGSLGSKMALASSSALAVLPRRSSIVLCGFELGTPPLNDRPGRAHCSGPVAGTEAAPARMALWPRERIQIGSFSCASPSASLLRASSSSSAESLLPLAPKLAALMLFRRRAVALLAALPFGLVVEDCCRGDATDRSSSRRSSSPSRSAI